MDKSFQNEEDRIPQNVYVCSNHFTEKDYISQKEEKVPSIDCERLLFLPKICLGVEKVLLQQEKKKKQERVERLNARKSFFEKLIEDEVRLSSNHDETMQGIDNVTP